MGEETSEELELEMERIKQTKAYKYHGVILSKDENSTDDINKFGEGKRVIPQLNSVLWNNKICSKQHMMWRHRK